MSTRKQAQSKWAFILSALVLALSGACGSSAADSTPTLSVEEVFTAAVQTLQAQQATQLALTPPTATASPSPFPTLALPSPVATLPFVVPTSSGSTASGCNNAAYVADVTVPDGTAFKPGASFDKTWTLLNTGSCPWNTSYKLAFFSGEGMSGSAAAVPSTVNAGSQVNMTVHLVAPSSAGSYTGYWRMQTDQGTGFGGSVYVQITVSGTAGSTSTSGPSPTATNTVSAADQTATAAAAP
ncbi:MAG: NBR1-Ig-like domain-containing protein, partial [Anaerolineales bacterium]